MNNHYFFGHLPSPADKLNTRHNMDAVESAKASGFEVFGIMYQDARWQYPQVEIYVVLNGIQAKAGVIYQGDATNFVAWLETSCYVSDTVARALEDWRVRKATGDQFPLRRDPQNPAFPLMQL